MRKLKQSEIKAYREEMLANQGGECALCSNKVCQKPVLDHAHRDPHKDKIRGVICNWCNIALGKCENARIRTGTSWGDFAKLFEGLHMYIHWDYSGADWHPSKRKSDVITFKKMSSLCQLNLLLDLGFDGKTRMNNQAVRVKMFRKLNANS